MRISDWSSDVCSSDLIGLAEERTGELVEPLVALCPLANDLVGLEPGQRALDIVILATRQRGIGPRAARIDDRIVGGVLHVAPGAARLALGIIGRRQIGRATCRARVCSYVSISVVAGSFKK